MKYLKTVIKATLFRHRSNYYIKGRGNLYYFKSLNDQLIKHFSYCTNDFMLSTFQPSKSVLL